MLTLKILAFVVLVLRFSSLNAAATNLPTKTRFLRFESEPESVYTELNKKVHLKCLAKPKKSRIQWLINEEPVRIDEKAIFTTPDSLIIQLPERTDQNVGLYSFDELVKSEIQCRAEYKNQVLLSQPAKIIVAFLNDFPYSEDEVKVDIKERQIAVIPCKPPNSPPRVVTNFAFKNKLIESNDEKYYLMPSGNLQIFNVSMDDSGLYQCIAYNPWLKERKNSTNLVTLHVEKQFHNPYDVSLEHDKSVTEKLEFLSTPKQKYSVIRGTDLQIFECVASSILPVNVSWSREDGKPLPKNRFKIVGGNLILSGVQVTDQGSYNCEATNGHKTITATSELEVKQTPSIKTELESKQIQIGEQTEFECSVNGNPISRIDWYLNGLKLTNLNSAQYDVRIESVGEDTSKLIIQKASEFHSGIVQCFASNDVSTVYSIGKLEVNSLTDNSQSSLTPANAANKSNKRTKSNRNRNKSSSDMAVVNKPKIIRLSSDSVIVHWKIPKQSRLPIIFFKIQYRDPDQFNTTLDWTTVEDDIPPNINSFSITQLQSDRFYKFRIMAAYKNQDSKDGKVSDRFFLAKNPINPRPTTIPNIFESKSDNSNSIEIYWDCRFGLDEQVDGFIIHYRPTQSAEIYHKITIDNNRTRAHTITHLAQSKQYDIRIQSFNSGGVSDFSKITTVRTLSALTSDGEEDDIDEPQETPDNNLNPPIDNNHSSKEDEQAPPNVSHSNEDANKRMTVDQSPNQSADDHNKPPAVEDKPKVQELPNNSISESTTNENNTKPTSENEQDNLKSIIDPLSTQSPLFYVIVSIIVLINLIILVYCYIIVKRWVNRKKNNKQKSDNKFDDLDDENFILKPEEDSFTKMNVFNEPLYSNNGILSTNPHLTRKAIRSYNHNYATIGGKERNMFSNKNDVYDSSLMNVRVNKFCDDSIESSITNSLLAINKTGNNQITKRDLPNHRMSTTISHYNLTRPSADGGNHTIHHSNTMHHSNIHNKNLLLPELPETNLKAITSTLGRHRPTTRNFEDLYGTTGIHSFATINRSNSVARLNGGTLERKRKSRNDLFSVLNIKEENELGPTQIVDLQGSPNYRAVRFVNNNQSVVNNNMTNGGLNSNINGGLHSNMSMMSNGIMNSTLNVGTINGGVINSSGLNNLANLNNLSNLTNNVNTSLNSSNMSSNLMNNSMNNYENNSPRPAYLAQQQPNLTAQTTQQQQQQLTNNSNNRPVGITMMQSSC